MNGLGLCVGDGVLEYDQSDVYTEWSTTHVVCSDSYTEEPSL